MPSKKGATAKVTNEIENQKKQDEENQLLIETEPTSPKKVTNKIGTKSSRLRKKSEAEKLQEEASGFIERVNKKTEVGDDSTEEDNDEEQHQSSSSKKKTKTTGARNVGGSKRQPAKNMPKHDEQDEEQEEEILKVHSVKNKGSIEDDNDDNEDDSLNKKTKGKTGRKQGQKIKVNPQENENEIEQKINRKGKGLGSTKKQISEHEEIPINDELKLSEEDEIIEEKFKSTTTTKKAPTKRCVPVSGKKTAVTSTKKKGQIDEPFEDRTNDEAENNIEDEPSAAKQAKKGRLAPASASKTTNRTVKKATK